MTATATATRRTSNLELDPRARSDEAGERYDVVILGGGPAGEAVVRRLDGAGLSVALVERERVGGECAFWACVPSKTLLRAPEVRAEARRVRGLTQPRARWAQIVAYRDFMISGLDDAGKATKMEAAGATLIRGTGRIAGPGRIAVGDSTVVAGHIVVATGTEPVVPAIDGIDQIAVWTTRDVYTMAAPPKDAIVLGGGPVGIETAQMLCGHGTRVTVVQDGGRLLPREDAAVGDELARRLAEDGIDLHLGVAGERVEGVGGRVKLFLGGGPYVEAERLVVAVGRRPCVDEIGLETIGLEPGASGGIDVDERCRAANGVWAVGDVTAVMPFTHVAHYQGEIAADDILARPRQADYRAIPRVVFSDPEVAAVGLTPEQAREQGLAIELGTVSLERLARTGTYGTGYRGFMTVIADRDKGVLVGAFAVGPLASEWIGASVIAIKARIPIATLRDTPMQFPTFGEALSYAVEDLELARPDR
jgi:pyruvate/2-oxoglutarate dehydrogenase complex dihydrolipoamide dehydrogenase (E3) component